MRMAALQLDLRGEECPVPTLKAVAAMREARGRGEHIVVIVDDAICAADIPYEAGLLGYATRTELTADSLWTITITPGRTPGTREGEAR